MGQTDHALRHRPDEQPAQPGPSVGRQDDELRAQLGGERRDLAAGVPDPDLGVGAREALLGEPALQQIADPLDDAAEAAKICANLASRQQPCETSVFDGQRLALDVPSPAPRAVPRHRAAPRPPHPEPPKPAHPPVGQPAH